MQHTVPLYSYGGVGHQALNNCWYLLFPQLLLSVSVLCKFLKHTVVYITRTSVPQISMSTRSGRDGNRSFKRWCDKCSFLPRHRFCTEVWPCKSCGFSIDSIIVNAKWENHNIQTITIYVFSEWLCQHVNLNKTLPVLPTINQGAIHTHG